MTDRDPARDEWIRRVLGLAVPSPQDTASSGPVSLAVIARQSLAWRGLCASVKTDIATLQSEAIAALEGSGLYDDDELAEARDDLARLDGIFSVISPDISGLVDDVINAAPTARAAPLQVVIGAIGTAEASIGADPAIADAQDNGVRKLDLMGPALAALDQLRRGLQPLLAA